MSREAPRTRDVGFPCAHEVTHASPDHGRWLASQSPWVCRELDAALAGGAAWFAQSAAAGRCDLKVMNLNSGRQIVIASLANEDPAQAGSCDLSSLAWSEGRKHLILSPSESRDPLGNDRFVVFHLPADL